MGLSGTLWEARPGGGGPFGPRRRTLLHHAAALWPVACKARRGAACPAARSQCTAPLHARRDCPASGGGRACCLFACARPCDETSTLWINHRSPRAALAGSVSGCECRQPQFPMACLLPCLLLHLTQPSCIHTMLLLKHASATFSSHMRPMFALLFCPLCWTFKIS